MSNQEPNQKPRSGFVDRFVRRLKAWLKETADKNKAQMLAEMDAQEKARKRLLVLQEVRRLEAEEEARAIIASRKSNNSANMEKPNQFFT